jgi:hypothetical protein
MKLPRRNFLHLAASAAALPVLRQPLEINSGAFKTGTGCFSAALIAGQEHGWTKPEVPT